MTMSTISHDPLHELTNQLAIVIGFADVLLDEIEAGDRRRADVEQILTAAHSAIALLPQLAVRPATGSSRRDAGDSGPSGTAR